MTVSQLLSTLSHSGIQLRADGDKLRFHPRWAVTPKLLGEMRHHTPALLARLHLPQGPCPECGSAILDRLQGGRVMCPGCTSVDPDQVTERLLWVDAPPELINYATDRRLCEALRESNAIRCPTCCGSRAFGDFSIHEGRSVRRDCARCGRFIGFPVWYVEQPSCSAEPFAIRRNENAAG